MGLPVWREPVPKTAENAVKADPTAAARSSIRRRPSIHGRRSTRPRLNRGTTVLPPGYERTALPQGVSNTTPGFGRGVPTAVPPISMLLESANGRVAPPPPPVPEARNYYSTSSNTARARDTRSNDESGAAQGSQASLEQQVNGLRERLDHRRSRHRSGSPAQRSRRMMADEHPRPRQRVPEPVQATANRWPQYDGPITRVTLPTPPLDASEQDADYLQRAEARARSEHASHPLRNSWTPDSPVDGLGDRNRSPTPGDGWEIMRSTITPDATLPSADSSFTSAAASHSFTSAADTAITEPDSTSSTDPSQRNSSDQSNDDSASSVDGDDLICDDDGVVGAEAIAEHVYDNEIDTTQGRERIRRHESIRLRYGNRFALAHESGRVDIGFRLIEEALETEQGRSRLSSMGVFTEAADDEVDDFVQSYRMRHPRYGQITRARSELQNTDAPPSPQPERYADDALAAAREASAQVHDYFRRYTADSLNTRTRSPPPEDESLALHVDAEVVTSRDEPQAHPVSPPSERSRVDVEDAESQTDLEAMRGIIERLARRDDVPDEWWQSVGLSVSRPRPRAASPRRDDHVVESAAGSRVRTGRVDRRISHL
ncbi:hypothetical protein BAUCODRAFT_147665 [Baudoinia panamericana UAMH 10762]|uniref:Uncharacterized protein n=1 Tax=Baudoinia panamericana (strain UAMH 10762) TaxID=717646 RepID=M2NEE8_BAUPA|nr:uncharacterized protein BAUCODRAFT_147665 [Baudoinia panamericana UAMH 10762]EMC97604.1 hypothetical protein BAUCODRAFT_147665 [Baudoinia panamericana UAMH 10762]